LSLLALHTFKEVLFFKKKSDIVRLNEMGSANMCKNTHLFCKFL
jgi:hypothetical protein